MGTQVLADIEVDAIYRDFLGVIEDNGGYQGIAEVLAKKLRVSILIEDEFFRVLARSYYNIQIPISMQKKPKIRYWKPQRTDPAVMNKVIHDQISSRPVEIPELPDYGVTYPRLVFTILGKGNIRGYLHVFKTDLDRDQTRIVQAALHYLALLETFLHSKEELKAGIMKNLILGLIFNEKGDDSNVHVEKSLLGFDLSQEAVLVVIQIESPPGLRKIEDVLHSLVSDLSSCINACATAISDDQAVVLVQSSDGVSIEPVTLAEYLQELFRALKIIFKESRVKIGVGRNCSTPQDYQEAFAEALKALSFNGQKSENDGVVYYYTIKLIGFMMELTNTHSLQRFVQDVLGEMYKYGLANHINLIESVECYLSHDCCIQSAARQLFIHPNTLRYRLAKAAKISGLDLANNDTKLELQLAIKLFRYQNEFLGKI